MELAKGSVRDSLTLADQAISHCDGNLTEPEISKLHGVLDISSTTKLFEAIFSNSVDEVINEIKRYKSLDVNYDILFDRALSFLHASMVDGVLSDEESKQDLHLYYQFFTNGLIDAKQTGNKRDCFDIAVLRCLTFSGESDNTLKKKPELVKKQEPEKPSIKKQEPTKVSAKEKIIDPSDKANDKKNGIKLTPDNWLDLFEKLDLSGPSRAFFSNLQLQKVEEKKLFFNGTNLFVERINEGDSDNLIKSLKKLGHDGYSVEVESSESVKNTPSQDWVKKRKKDIQEFKKEIIDSELLINLKENFGEEITEDKITITDHEE